MLHLEHSIIHSTAPNKDSGPWIEESICLLLFLLLLLTHLLAHYVIFDPSCSLPVLLPSPSSVLYTIIAIIVISCQYTPILICKIVFCCESLLWNQSTHMLNQLNDKCILLHLLLYRLQFYARFWLHQSLYHIGNSSKINLFFSLFAICSIDWNFTSIRKQIYIWNSVHHSSGFDKQDANNSRSHESLPAIALSTEHSYHCSQSCTNCLSSRSSKLNHSPHNLRKVPLVERVIHNFLLIDFWKEHRCWDEQCNSQ